ncbi:MAG: sulfotransferase, partial [Opitutales bacterium]
RGPFGPSEASSFFKRWFGGEHPSETCSKEPLPGMETPMLETFAALHGLSGFPLLFKNAWNCFRIESLARLFPASCFVWIRRDIGQAARSDLEARAHRGGYDVWNSATPGNHLEIRQRPHWEQVVEQQYEYGRRIAADFSSNCPDRSLQVWYEDLCLEPEKTLQRLEDFFLGLGMGNVRREPGIAFSPSLRKRDLDSEEEGRRILSYVKTLPDDRLSSFCHTGETAPC